VELNLSSPFPALPLRTHGRSRDSRQGQEIFFLSSPQRPDRLWGQPSRYHGLFLRGVKLTIYIQLMPRSRIRGSIHPLPHTSSWRSAYLVKHGDNFTFFVCKINNLFSISFETEIILATVGRADCAV
jgi:hypothetical protein